MARPKKGDKIVFHTRKELKAGDTVNVYRNTCRRPVTVIGKLDEDAENEGRVTRYYRGEIAND